jgi:hypothetical protein
MKAYPATATGNRVMPDAFIAARAAITKRLEAVGNSQGLLAALIYAGALILAALPLLIGSPVTGIPLF